MATNYSVGLADNSTLENSDALVQCFMFTGSVALKLLMVVGYSVVMATSIVGNSILAFVYIKNKSMKNTVNCCIMNLVFADLLVTLVYMPRMVVRIVVRLEGLVEGILGLILSKIVSISQEVSICVSILTVVIVAFERFFAVAFPLRMLVSKKLSIGLLCATWLVSLAARSPMSYAVKPVRFPSGRLGCFLDSYSQFSNERSQKVLPHFYAYHLLWSPPFFHNNSVRIDISLSKTEASLHWKCDKGSRFSNKQESHLDEPCSDYGFSVMLVVVFYRHTPGRVLECSVIV